MFSCTPFTNSPASRRTKKSNPQPTTTIPVELLHCTVSSSIWHRQDWKHNGALVAIYCNKLQKEHKKKETQCVILNLPEIAVFISQPAFIMFCRRRTHRRLDYTIVIFVVVCRNHPFEEEWRYKKRRDGEIWRNVGDLCEIYKKREFTRYQTNSTMQPTRQMVPCMQNRTTQQRGERK